MQYGIALFFMNPRYREKCNFFLPSGHSVALGGSHCKKHRKQCARFEDNFVQPVQMSLLAPQQAFRTMLQCIRTTGAQPMLLKREVKVDPTSDSIATSATSSGTGSTTQSELIGIPVGVAKVEGVLALPPSPIGIVLFAHGSGSSRFSPRNNYVAGELHQAGIGTLLMDLLTPQEDLDLAQRFDIALLTERLNGAVDWLRSDSRTRSLALGLFGASTGAAAALQLAALRPADVKALVLRGGRTDMAESSALAKICTPTLLLVGGFDDVVIDINRATYAALQCERSLQVIDGATHLFEEYGKLEAMAGFATSWFAWHLAPVGQRNAELRRE
jgi:putative phosphoribosyl transferase